MFSIIKRDFKKCTFLFVFLTGLEILLCLYAIYSSLPFSKLPSFLAGLLQPLYGWQYSVIFCFNVLILLVSFQIIYGDLENSREFILLRISRKKLVWSKGISLFLENILFHLIIGIFVLLLQVFFYQKVNLLFILEVCSHSFLYHSIFILLGILLYDIPHKIGIVVVLALSFLPFLWNLEMTYLLEVVLVILTILLAIVTGFYFMKTIKKDRRI